MFHFADRRWGSFFVSRRGLITFGEPPTYVESRFWFVRMSEIASEFVTVPTISPLFKLFLGGESSGYGATQHVSHRPDRVVVTWITTDPDSHVHGIPPEQPARFQAVLGADGSIRFHYGGCSLRRRHRWPVSRRGRLEGRPDRPHPGPAESATPRSSRFGGSRHLRGRVKWRQSDRGVRGEVSHADSWRGHRLQVSSVFR